MIYTGVVNETSWFISTDGLPRWAQNLPIWEKIDEIVRSLLLNQITFIIGETGCGKSLTIQYIIGQLQDQKLLPYGKSMLAEPYIATALSLHKTLQEVLQTEVNLFTGLFKENQHAERYSIGTAGSILRHIRQCRNILIDEVHDPDGPTFMLLGAALLETERKQNTRIVAMSGTLDEALLNVYKSFFAGKQIGVITIDQRMYALEKIPWQIPGETFEEQLSSFVEHIVFDAASSLRNNHNMLVFVPSPIYFSRLVEKTESLLSLTNNAMIEILTFSGAARDQVIIPEEGWFGYVGIPYRETISLEEYIQYGASATKRSIIFCTDVVRAGISILRVEKSVTSGWQVRPYYYPDLGWGGVAEEVTSINGISQELARAGRFMKGYGYYIHNSARPSHDIPSLHRYALGQTLLILISLGYNPTTFPFVIPPKPEAVEIALSELEALGAIEGNEEEWWLTSIGYPMSLVNAEPHYARMAIDAHMRGVLPLLLISISANEREVFWNPDVSAGWERISWTKEEIKRRQRNISDPNSDYLSMIKVWYYWQKSDYSQSFSTHNCLHYNGLKAMKIQLKKLCDSLDGITYEYQGERHTINIQPSDLRITYPLTEKEKENLGKAILTGLPKNVFYTKSTRYTGVSLAIHPVIFPGSVVKEDASWVVGKVEAMRNKGGFWLRFIHTIRPEWIPEVLTEAVTIKLDDISYNPETQVLSGNEVFFLYGNMFMKRPGTMQVEDQALHWALGFVTDTVKHGANPFRHANKQKLLEVEEINLKSLNQMGSLTLMDVALYLQQRFTTCTSLKEAQKVSIILQDEDISTMLGIDYPSIREMLKKECPENWSIGNYSLKLHYQWDLLFKGIKLELPLNLILDNHLNDGHLPLWDSVTTRISTNINGYETVFVDILPANIDMLRQLIFTRAGKKAAIAFTKGARDPQGSIHMHAHYETGLPVTPTPIVWNKKNNALIYPVWVIKSKQHTSIEWVLKWYLSEDEASYQRHECYLKWQHIIEKEKQKEGDTRITVKELELNEMKKMFYRIDRLMNRLGWMEKDIIKLTQSGTSDEISIRLSLEELKTKFLSQQSDNEGIRNWIYNELSKIETQLHQKLEE